MLFSSITFLYIFLPCVTVLYYIVPGKARNYVLLAGSLVFYALGERVYIYVMLFEILIGYLTGLLLEGCSKGYSDRRIRLCILWAAVFLDVVILIRFKYTGLVRLPIGISFYTFQIISYIVDVYRGTVPPQKNLFLLGAYVAMFPQLIAGPIVRYHDVAKQLVHRSHSFALAASGIRRFAIGLGKKVLIANELGELCSIFRESDDVSVLYYWLYAIAYTLQIYHDFSGYSDMAIGLGRIFGFDYSENFRYPYISGSITEFWRRWHISLGSWFRDYVYIPLGGSRVSERRWNLNIFIVWSLTGLWHGASLNFVIWGIYFAMFLVLEKRCHGTILSKSRVLRYTYAMFFVIISFVIFNAASPAQAAGDIACMFGLRNIPVISTECVYYMRSYMGILIAAVIGSIPAFEWIRSRTRNRSVIITAERLCEPIILIMLFIMVTAYLVDGSFNPFLYFRF